MEFETNIFTSVNPNLASTLVKFWSDSLVFAIFLFHFSHGV